MNATQKTAAASRQTEALTTATPTGDRLLTFRQVAALTGSDCKTGHTCRAWAKRGLIRAVRINDRVIRYSEASVRALIEGRTA